MIGNVGASLESGARAGATMISPMLEMNRFGRQLEFEKLKLALEVRQKAMELSLKYGDPDDPQNFEKINAQLSGQYGLTPQDTQKAAVAQQVIQQRQQQAQQQQQQQIQAAMQQKAMQASQSLPDSQDSTVSYDQNKGLQVKTSLRGAAQAAVNPLTAPLVQGMMQKAMSPTSTDIAQPITNPQSSKFDANYARRLAMQQPKSLHQPEVTQIVPRGTETARPAPQPTQTYKSFADIPSDQFKVTEGGKEIGAPEGVATQGGISASPFEFAASKEKGVPTEQAGLSPEFMNFVKEKEGFNPNAYADGAQTSIGYGTRALSKNEKISEPEAEQRLASELLQSREAVMTAAQQKGLQLAPNQLDALVSFDYNTGAGAKVLAKAKSLEDIPKLMAQYTHFQGEVNKGLLNRRAEEIQMFNGGMNTKIAGFAGMDMPVMAKNIQQAQNPFQRQDLSNVVPEEVQQMKPQKQKEFALAQKEGLPFVANTTVDYVDPRARGFENIQKAISDNVNSERELYRKGAPERAAAMASSNKMLEELRQFAALNGVESTSPLKGEFNAVTKNVMTSPEWQRMNSLARNLYASIDKSGTQVRNLAEFNAFSQGMPNLSTDAKANAMTINTLKALTERTLDELTARDKYFRIKHTTDGFDDAWAKFSQDVPLMNYNERGQPILNPERRNYQDYFRALNVGQQPQLSQSSQIEGAKVFNSHEEALKSGYRGRAIINGRPATIKD